MADPKYADNATQRRYDLAQALIELNQIPSRIWGEVDVIATTNWTNAETAEFLRLVRKARSGE